MHVWKYIVQYVQICLTMDVCRSSLPRAPSLPGADLGSGTHHATTLAILSHCQHADADADGADDDLGSGTHHATTLAMLSHCQHADTDADGSDDDLGSGMLMVLIMLMQYGG